MAGVVRAAAVCVCVDGACNRIGLSQPLISIMAVKTPGLREAHADER